MGAKVSHFNPVRPFDKQLLSGNVSLTRAALDDFWVREKLC